MILTQEEQVRQEMFNEYVIWRLEMIQANPGITFTDFSTFDEWREVNYPTPKPKLKKRKKLEKTQ